VSDTATKIASLDWEGCGGWGCSDNMADLYGKVAAILALAPTPDALPSRDNLQRQLDKADAALGYNETDGWGEDGGRVARIRRLMAPTPPDALLEDVIAFVRWSANVRDDTPAAIAVARDLLARMLRFNPQPPAPAEGLDVERLADAMYDADQSHGGYECCAPSTHANAAAIAREYAKP
jgi:hypothetical protein